VLYAYQSEASANSLLKEKNKTLERTTTELDVSQSDLLGANTELKTQKLELETTNATLKTAEKKLETANKQLARKAEVEERLRSIAEAKTVEVESERRQVAASRLGLQADLMQTERADFLSRAVLLAGESIRQYHSLEADLAIRNGIAMLPGFRGEIQFPHRSLSSPINEIALDTSGRSIAVTVGDTVKIYDVATRTSKYAPIKFETPVKAVAVDSKSGLVRAVEVDTKRNMAVVTTRRALDGADVGPPFEVPYEEYPGHLALSPDAKYFAMSTASAAWLWCLADRSSFDLQLTDASELAFSGGGNRLAAANWNNVVVWDLNQPDGPKQEMSMAVDGIAHIALSPDGSELAVADRHKTVLLMTTKGRIYGSRNFGLFSPGSVALAPHGEYVVTNDPMGRCLALVWDRQMTRKVAVIESSRPNARQYAFAPDSGILEVFDSNNGKMTFWDVSVTDAFATLSGDARNLDLFDPVPSLTSTRDDYTSFAAISPSGKLLLRISAGPTITIRDTETGRDKTVLPRISEVPTVPGTAREYTAFFIGEGYFGLASNYEGLFVVAVNDGSVITHIDSTLTKVRVEANVKGEGSVVAALEDRVLRLIKLPSGEQLDAFDLEGADSRDHNDWYRLLDVSEGGKYIVAYHYGGVGTGIDLVVWQRGKHSAPQRIQIKENLYGNGEGAFSNDADWFALNNLEGGQHQIILLDVRQKWRETIFWTPSGNEKITDFAFSPDNRYFAVCTEGFLGGLVRVVDFATRKELCTLQHEAPISSLAFSHDGRMLATGTFDTARIWELPKGRLIGHISTDIKPRVGFSTDDRFVFTASSSAKVSWIRPEDLIHEACRRLRRNLSVDEWTAYFGNSIYCRTCANLPPGEGAPDNAPACLESSVPQAPRKAFRNDSRKSHRGGRPPAGVENRIPSRAVTPKRVAKPRSTAK
jgi:WD40 repeat protein